MEDLQKMMVVALVYRVLVCVYEVSLSASSGGADAVNTEKQGLEMVAHFFWLHYYIILFQEKLFIDEFHARRVSGRTSPATLHHVPRVAVMQCCIRSCRR